MTNKNRLSIHTMKYSAILKQIKITNSDTDSYITIMLELNNNNTLDLNYLNNLRLKTINIEIEEDSYIV